MSNPEEELDIGDLENETVFVPTPDDVVSHEHDQMHMGKGHENDLRDPWFHTPEGQAWLEQQEGWSGS